MKKLKLKDSPNYNKPTTIYCLSEAIRKLLTDKALNLLTCFTQAHPIKYKGDKNMNYYQKKITIGNTKMPVVVDENGNIQPASLHFAVFTLQKERGPRIVQLEFDLMLKLYQFLDTKGLTTNVFTENGFPEYDAELSFLQCYGKEFFKFAGFDFIDSDSEETDEEIEETYTVGDYLASLAIHKILFFVSSMEFAYSIYRY